MALGIARDRLLFESLEQTGDDIGSAWDEDALDRWATCRVRVDDREVTVESVTFMLGFGGPNVYVEGGRGDWIEVQAYWGSGIAKQCIDAPTIAAVLSRYGEEVEHGS